MADAKRSEICHVHTLLRSLDDAVLRAAVLARVVGEAYLGLPRAHSGSELAAGRHDCANSRSILLNDRRGRDLSR
jgi:hypothetical protein